MKFSLRIGLPDDLPPIMINSAGHPDRPKKVSGIRKLRDFLNNGNISGLRLAKDIWESDDSTTIDGVRWVTVLNGATVEELRAWFKKHGDAARDFKVTQHPRYVVSPSRGREPLASNLVGDYFVTATGDIKVYDGKLWILV